MNKILIFLYNDSGEMKPLTGVTQNRVKLRDAASNLVIYPDNINNPIFNDKGNGQYEVGPFNKAGFKTDQAYHKVKVYLDDNLREEFEVQIIGEPLEIFAMDAALSSEISNRQNAISEEVSARSTAISEEAQARLDGINNEANARTNADNEIIEAINNLSILPYTEAQKTFRIISGATPKANQNYPTILDGVSAIPENGVGYLLEICNKNDNRHIAGSTSLTLRNYINFRGKSKILEIIVCEGIVNKYHIFENLILWFGSGSGVINGNYAGVRTYTNHIFRNSLIFAYNNTNFVDCDFEGTKVIHATGKAATLGGYTTCDAATYFNNDVAITGDNVLLLGTGRGVGNALIRYKTFKGVMPDDPTQPI